MSKHNIHIDDLYKFIDKYIPYFNEHGSLCERMNFIYDFEIKEKIVIPNSLKRVYLYDNLKLKRNRTGFNTIRNYFKKMVKEKYNSKVNLNILCYYDEFYAGYMHTSHWISRVYCDYKKLNPKAFNSFKFPINEGACFTRFLNPKNSEGILMLIKNKRVYIDIVFKHFPELFNEKQLLEIISLDRFMKTSSVCFGDRPQYYSNIFSLFRYQKCTKKVINTVFDIIQYDMEKLKKVLNGIKRYHKSMLNGELLLKVLKERTDIELLYQLEGGN